MTESFRVHIVAVGEYDQAASQPQPTLAPEIYEDALVIADLLTTRLGGQLLGPLRRPGLEADRSWMLDRLDEWAAPESTNGGEVGPTSSILVWTGHGNSDGFDAWLSSSRSGWFDKERSLAASSIAAAISRENRARQADAEAWSIVVIQACQSQKIADAILRELTRTGDVPDRVILIFAGGEGKTELGVVAKALSAAIDSYTDNDSEIDVYDFAGNLGSRLAARRGGNAYQLKAANMRPIPRKPLLPDGITATQDVVSDLIAVVSSLDEDQRAHFLPKAQGGEQAELAWFFSGREKERATIAGWLRDDRGGALLVTGSPGSGKSALLGYVVAQSNPRLRELLVELGAMHREPIELLPPDGIFDAAIALTGRSADDVVMALSDTLLPDTVATDEGPLPRRIDALISGLIDNPQPRVLLFDALDEADGALTIASAILQRLAKVPGCRIIVGTRDSTNMTLDSPEPSDENLIDALGLGDALRLEVTAEPAAVAAYATRRLFAARVREPHKLNSLTDGAIWDIAMDLSKRSASFLFARLAVHEVIAAPILEQYRHVLDTERHTDLFLHAVARLSEQNAAFFPLLKALALSEGRGIPRIDRIWVTVASALHVQAISEDDATSLLAAAAPYIMLDSDNGQSVYRLAHRTFREGLSQMDGLDADDNKRVGLALLGLTSDVVDRNPIRTLNPFLKLHLPAYIANANLWAELAESSSVLDRLDLRSLSSQAYRSFFGRGTAPNEIASAIADRDDARIDDPDARAWQRLLGRARWSDLESYDDTAFGGPLSLRWAANDLPKSFSVILDSGVADFVVVRGPTGGDSVVTGYYDGRIVIWSVSNGIALRSIDTGGGPIRALNILVNALGDRVLSVLYYSGDFVFWSYPVLTAIGPALASQTDSRQMTLHRRDASPLILVWSARGLSFWDPFDGREVANGRGLTRQWDVVSATVDYSGRFLLAARNIEVEEDEIIIWDPVEGAHVGAALVPPLLTCRVFFARVGGKVYVVTAGVRVVVFDPFNGSEPIAFDRPQTRTTAADVIRSGHGDILALGYSDGAVWIVRDSNDPPAALTGVMEYGEVRRMELIPSAAGIMLAVDFSAAVTQVYDLSSDALVCEYANGKDPWIRGLSSSELVEVPGQPPMLAEYDISGPLIVRRMTTGELAAVAAAGDHGKTALPFADGRLVSLGLSESNLRMWDLHIESTHQMRVDEFAAQTPHRLAFVPGRALLVRENASAVEVWDPLNRVRLLTVPGTFAGGVDGATLVLHGQVGYVSVSDRGEVSIWATLDGVAIAVIPAREVDVSAVKVVDRPGDVDIVVIIYADNLVRIWNQRNPLDAGQQVQLPNGNFVHFFRTAYGADTLVSAAGARLTVTRLDGPVELGILPIERAREISLPYQVGDQADAAIVRGVDGSLSYAYVDLNDVTHLVDLRSGIEEKLFPESFNDRALRSFLLPQEGDGALTVLAYRERMEIWDLSTRSRVGLLAHTRGDSARVVQLLRWADGKFAVGIGLAAPLSWLLWEGDTRIVRELGSFGDSRLVLGVDGPEDERYLVSYGGDGLLVVRDDNGVSLDEVKLGMVRELRVDGSRIYCTVGPYTYCFEVGRVLLRQGD